MLPFSLEKIMATRIVRGQKVNQRKMRAPHTNFHIKTRPWQIQPFCIFPVLPGETMQNAMWKSRVVSDPVKNRLIGWWKEYYLFYVRFRDLVDNDDFKKIFTDPEANLSTYYSAADPKYYHKYGVNFLKMGVEKIVEHYFRSDDEAPADATLDGMWAASIQNDSWLDSVMSGDFLDDVDVEIADADGDTKLEMSEWHKASRMYEMLKANGFTDMSYEDFLGTYGVKVAPLEQEGKPWLLRNVRSWTMPSNTIVPETGAATTAVTWQVDENANERRFFKEPGFVIGLTIARPKIYLANVDGSLSGIMDTAMEWLPAIMRDDPHSSLIKLQANQGPLTGQTKAYALDLRDLFLYGEDFSNYALAAVDNAIAMPRDGLGLGKRYPALTDAQGVFFDGGGAGTKQFLEEDGRIDLRIATALVDTTPPVSRLAV